MPSSVFCRHLHVTYVHATHEYHTNKNKMKLVILQKERKKEGGREGEKEGRIETCMQLRQ